MFALVPEKSLFSGVKREVFPDFPLYLRGILSYTLPSYAAFISIWRAIHADTGDEWLQETRPASGPHSIGSHRFSYVSHDANGAGAQGDDLQVLQQIIAPMLRGNGGEKGRTKMSGYLRRLFIRGPGCSRIQKTRLVG